jgi:hypothetical protein
VFSTPAGKRDQGSEPRDRFLAFQAKPYVRTPKMSQASVRNVEIPAPRSVAAGFSWQR